MFGHAVSSLPGILHEVFLDEGCHDCLLACMTSRGTDKHELLNPSNLSVTTKVPSVVRSESCFSGILNFTTTQFSSFHMHCPVVVKYTFHGFTGL